ncbi:MAG: hypothetical protein V3T23_01135, partial [Nitrososphaerales archaeon]
MILPGFPQLFLSSNMYEAEQEFISLLTLILRRVNGTQQHFPEEAPKKHGVKDVAFAKKCGLTIENMVRSSWVYKQL